MPKSTMKKKIRGTFIFERRRAVQDKNPLGSRKIKREICEPSNYKGRIHMRKT
ncbi:hypothetical protein [Candidatus Enterococcus wittei]|uniref:hypothetical protein n=1 Tax=Candidatus Enterococcus wittei TaxID=1987383 RepID=UPI0012B57FB2|nr:hypothetical protein [Enterococcus sp. 10A9_DIV0425]